MMPHTRSKGGKVAIQLPPNLANGWRLGGMGWGGWARFGVFHTHHLARQPVEQGPLSISSLLMLGLLASGGAKGEGGWLCQRKLHHGGQVQLAADGRQGRRRRPDPG